MLFVVERLEPDSFPGAFASLFRVDHRIARRLGQLRHDRSSVVARPPRPAHIKSSLAIVTELQASHQRIQRAVGQLDGQRPARAVFELEVVAYDNLFAQGPAQVRRKAVPATQPVPADKVYQTETTG